MKFLLGMATGAFVSLITTTTPDQAIANWHKWDALISNAPGGYWMLAGLIGSAIALMVQGRCARDTAEKT